MGGGECHRSRVPSQYAANLADPAELRRHESRSMKNGQRSRADDGSIGPSALIDSGGVAGSTSAQQIVASCRSQRARAVPAATARRPLHRCTSVLLPLPLPRHGEPAAADLAASHTGLDGAILSIEGARTHAHGISTGAVAVFRAFQRAQPGVDRSRRRRERSPDHSSAEVYSRSIRSICPLTYW